MNELKDFFEAVSKEKKVQQQEVDELVSTSFDDFFVKPLIEEVKPKKKKVKKPTPNKVEVTEERINEVPSLLERSLGLLAEPSNVKQQKDPLTPIDQKFATHQDLQKQYSTFLSRIQQQLSTLGGGGETRLRYLDDVVGIATNSGVYNGKYLQWNSTTNRAEFTDPSDAETTTTVSVTGITTYYQASNIDDYIGVSANVPVEISLPISPIVGKKIIVKDEGNKISTYNIIVTVGAGVSVENDTSVVMKINHQSFTYFYNGSNWFLI
jgi:hypothetical protein